MSSLRELLAHYRSNAHTEREKGNYFERLAVAFIKNDPGMAQQFEDCWLFAEWAAKQGLDGRDTGIDAVAKLRGEEAFCAIQCKFYSESHRIQKSDIDSFFTASGKKHFSLRLIIDTTSVPWSANAEEALNDQNPPAQRISFNRLDSSPIDWAAYIQRDELKLAPPKEIRPHQQLALEAVRDGLTTADRGKLIMACGTGKTFTGLKIAENMTGAGRMVLFLVPSLALMSQTIREWTIDTATPIRAFAVCSDAQVGKRKKFDGDIAEIETHDLDYPATTNAARLAAKVAHTAVDRMTVVFSTYQSIQVIADAQSKHGLPEFDLIICDEAHRTTGATLDGEDESNFVKIHNQDFIAGRKRVYMTATPRVFGDAIKSKANEVSAVLCSMDDESLYGKELFVLGFGWAVENQLLSDYKVLVLAVDEQMVSSGVQRRLADGSSEVKLDDATKIIGCYKALSKHGLKEELLADPQPMKRGLAFCKDIATSKLIQREFAAVIAEYLASDEGRAVEDGESPLTCELEHVDGTFGAKARTSRLEWLKEERGDRACRILTNARCLFHYVYGLLHSDDYRDRFADNLSKELPRIPTVKSVADFRAFVEAGRALGDLHCDYDQAEPYPLTIAQGDLRLANISDPERFYRVEQMKFAGKRPKLDKTTVIYNGNITMTGIPPNAYDYVVNGKPALEWVMERQRFKSDPASGIVNDANRYAIETIGDPAYPLKLFQRVITVSLKTMEIVRALPPLGDLS